MPTRKQRRREAKAKRHEYEFVYLDEDGNELEEPPEDLVPEPKARRNGASPAAKKPAPKTRGGRTPRRTAQPPSWQRAARRAGLLGIVVFVLFSATAKGSNRYVTALVPAVIYTALFIPFTYMIDRFAYRRWQAKQEGGSAPAKKR